MAVYAVFFLVDFFAMPGGVRCKNLGGAERIFRGGNRRKGGDVL